LTRAEAWLHNSLGEEAPRQKSQVVTTAKSP
jgi:hypothetical protein